MSITSIYKRDDRFDFEQGPGPEHDKSDVLVQVDHISLNGGEPNASWEATVPVGWDASGVVVESDSRASGPTIGARVVTWGFSGAWSQQRSVPLNNLAEVPDSVDSTVAAALPVAGLTALRAIRQLGLVEGQRIAVTGASGGVGHLVVQLARNCNLDVTPIVRSEASRHWLIENNLFPEKDIRLVSELDPTYLFDGVLDVVGGPTLGRLLPTVAPGATVLLVGGSSREHLSVDTGWLSDRRISLVSFNNYATASTDLALLLDLVAQGMLRVLATDGGDWSTLTHKPLQELITRGKTTFTVPYDPAIGR
ncbi:zinc-binding dehydrogenase [Rhodococcoides yunnanense]|jgi:NADPH2:quinone reductase|uniref:zinc-binding dehydrogenase n=1 Tax=Rhodococcoides yunnanense TaxID=278209 RepID=UPI0022B12960|nr:zinc-binding dehydrogenase [Rhodococcus yunnanensis]MCZ4278510.1 zinc-binding dehydrogenase [Rhodococcus yunnanensis]